MPLFDAVWLSCGVAFAKQDDFVKMLLSTKWQSGHSELRQRMHLLLRRAAEAGGVVAALKLERLSRKAMTEANHQIPSPSPTPPQPDFAASIAEIASGVDSAIAWQQALHQGWSDADFQDEDPD
jgi:hypothetical protein